MFCSDNTRSSPPATAAPAPPRALALHWPPRGLGVNGAPRRWEKVFLAQLECEDAEASLWRIGGRVAQYRPTYLPTPSSLQLDMRKRVKKRRLIDSDEEDPLFVGADDVPWKKQRTPGSVHD